MRQSEGPRSLTPIGPGPPAREDLGHRSEESAKRATAWRIGNSGRPLCQFPTVAAAGLVVSQSTSTSSPLS